MIIKSQKLYSKSYVIGVWKLFELHFTGASKLLVLSSWVESDEILRFRNTIEEDRRVNVNA